MDLAHDKEWDYTVVACVSNGALHCLNERTWFSAIQNEVVTVVVRVIEKPDDFPIAGLQGEQERDDVQVILCSATDTAVRLPSELLDTGRQVRGHVVLEASGLIKPSAPQTLAALLRSWSPELEIEEYQGKRGYARVRVTARHEALACQIIKVIGRERRKHVKIKEVPATREYDSASE